MLKLTLTHAGKNSRIELDGVDISRFLSSVTVTADVGELTKATLTYSGAVVIEGETGLLEFVQKTYFVQCTDCAKALQGEAQDVRIIDRTGLGGESREYEPVAEPTT